MKIRWHILGLLALMMSAAHGQIYAPDASSGTISEYDAVTGTLINPALVSGLNGPYAIAISGSNLYVVNNGTGTVGEYNATTGAVENVTLVSGLNNPQGIVVSGANLYVTNSTLGTIGEYNATTGAVVNVALVTGLSSPTSIAVSGSNLYVTNGPNTIGEYNANNGAVINPAIISGLSGPYGVAISGANLYVVNSGTGILGEYNAATGATVNASFVTGLGSVFGVAISGSNIFTVSREGIGEYNATTGAVVNASFATGSLLGNTFDIAVGSAGSGTPVTDVGNYNISKTITYDQSSAAMPLPDPEAPFQFFAQVNPGSTGALLPTSTLTAPSGSTANIAFQAGPNGLQFEQDFPTQAALDAAFAAGNYTFNLETTTPNTYTFQDTLNAAFNYPPAQQITSMTNATWSGTHILVTDTTQPVTITFGSAGASSGYFQINNTSISQSFVPTGSTNGITIPANTFTANTAYQGSINLSNVNSNTTALNGVTGGSTYAVQINFIIEAGTVPPPTTTLYYVSKSHALVQTSNSAPVNGSGQTDNDAFDAAPYRFDAQSPVTGSVISPNNTLQLNFTTNENSSSGGVFSFSSGSISDQASLDSIYPDGSYTLADGHLANLTGDIYPNVPQITLVNGLTPIWNAQGQLVLNPANPNIITWTPFSITPGLFSTNGSETVEFQSEGSGSVDVKQKAGLTGGGTTTFNSLTIPAGTMTTEQTYVGNINYIQASSVNSPSTNVLDVAGYGTETSFTAIAAAPGTLAQTINFSALNPTQVVGTNVTLVATATSGLPVTFNVVSGPGTLTGNVLNFNGTGTVMVKASQVGNATYAAATATQTLTVSTTATGGIAQSISFTVPDLLNAATPYTLVATATSGLPVTFTVVSGPATLAGNVLTFTGTGTVNVNADQAGNGTYAAAATKNAVIVASAPTDLQNIQIQKSFNYVQSSAAAPALDPEQPYQFDANLNPVSTNELLSTSTFKNPSGATQYFQAGSNGLNFNESFITKAAMDAAFTTGTYNFTIQTSVPDTYSASLVLGADNYPTVIPQITSVINATWNANGHLVVTNPNAAVTFTFPVFNSAVGNISFQVNNTTINGSLAADGTHTTFSIPASVLTNNTLYQVNLSFQNGSNSNVLAGVNENVNFQNQLTFGLQVGTPTPSLSTFFGVKKGQVLIQTSSAAPVPAPFGDVYDQAPYNFELQSGTSGTTIGPGSVNYTLSYEIDNGEGNAPYRYSSGAISSLATLNSTYADGNYTLADGHVVALTGDVYTNAPQVTLVNGAAPIWNAQGQLVLDPTVANTIIWTAINQSAGTFATNCHEDFQIESQDDNSVNLKQKTGVGESSTLSFNTYTIPAGTMTTNSTYEGNLDYFLGSTVNSPSANVYDFAGYDIENNFVIVAQLLSSTANPTFTFNTAGSIGIAANGYIASGLLTFNLGFAPTAGTTLTVVNNTSSSPITGTFSNVPEGGTMSTVFGGTTYTFTATYKGGDGNDLTLTYTPPLPPSSLTILHNFGDNSVLNDGAAPNCSLVQGSDGNFYGTTENGGAAGKGTIFKVTPQGQITILHGFGDGSVSSDGSSPACGLVQGADGNFYGTTQGGGTAPGSQGMGTLFKITPQGQVTILHKFNDGSVLNDGQYPSAALVQASDGNFYGTTFGGGSASQGIVFKMTPQGQITVLHSFSDGSVINDGGLGGSNLVQGSDGNFYGTTQGGGTAQGTQGNGTVFRITSQGQVTILHKFGDGSIVNDGAAPFAGLVQGPDGNFYGATSGGGVGGSQGFGTVFKITPQGQITILHRFNDGSVPNDGQSPLNLILGLDGNYYGETETGGSNPLKQGSFTGEGTVYKITPQGVVTLLHSFGDGSVLNDGEFPNGAGLVQGSDGTFYGTTQQGGTGSAGTIFKFSSGLPIITSPLTANGTVGLPFSFQTTGLNTPTIYAATGLPAGLSINPATGLISGTPTTVGTSAVVLTLSNNKGPASAPLTITIAPLPVPAVTSILSAYGTVETLFSYTIVATNNATAYTATGPAAGALPSWLTLTGNVLTGTPPAAGTFPITLTASNGAGSGASVTLTIQITSTPPTASQEYNLLYQFSNGRFSPANDASRPNVLFQGFDGTFYGLSSGGGSGFSGAIFNLTTQGIDSVFHSFGTGASDGFSPQGLLQADDGNFYGTTYLGGTANLGAVFKFTPAGVETILHSFGDGSVVNDGSAPQSAGLAQGADGNFYGVTTTGGSKGLGVVYKITPLGVVTILHNFGDGSVANDGANPMATLIQGQAVQGVADNNFYGTTQKGGASGAGVIFKITPQGAVTILHSFQSGTVLNQLGASVTDGANPVAPLVEMINGATALFYGTAQNGGTAGKGTAFQMTPAGAVTVMHSFGDGSVTNDGTNPVAPLILGYDGNFYGTTNLGGTTSANYTQGAGTVFNITPQGAVTIIHRFSDGSVTNDGAFPNGALCQGADGNFYGTTSAGGAGSGTFFSIVTTQGATHVPVFTGASTISAAALSPFTFTPKASFGVSNGVATGSLVQSGFVPQLIKKSFDHADDWVLVGTLPQFLSFDSISGTLTGTPIEPGIYTVTMTPSNAAGPGTSQTITLYVNVAPVLTSPTTATGTGGSSFSYQVAANASPTSFGATGLPAWLSVNTMTGVISGTPPGSGTFIFSPTATNLYGTSTEQVTLTVSGGPASAPAITSSTTAAVTVGNVFNYQIAATNTPTGFSALSLPTGLLFNAATGAISGTPTTVGTYQVPISVSNAAGSASSVLTVTVNPISAPVITSCSAITCTPSTVISYQITGTNMPTSFSAVGLPNGLTLNTKTGAITGTPSVVGTANVALAAANSIGTGTASLSINVTQAAAVPALTSAPTANSVATLPFPTYQITASNTATGTNSFFAVGLPAGLTLNTSTGAITGSPTTPGTYNVTLYITNSISGTGASNLTLAFTNPKFSDWATLYPNVTNVSVPTATPLNDGVPNLLKYFYDINPSAPMSATDRAALPTAGMAVINNTEYLTLTYRQYAIATGISMNVQTSSDLKTWTTMTNPNIVPVGTDTNTNDPIMQVQVPVGGSRQFIQLNLGSQ